MSSTKEPISVGLLKTAAWPRRITRPSVRLSILGTLFKTRVSFSMLVPPPCIDVYTGGYNLRLDGRQLLPKFVDRCMGIGVCGALHLEFITLIDRVNERPHSASPAWGV